MASISRRGFMKGALAVSAFPLLSSANETGGNTPLKFIHVTDSHMDLSNDESVEAMELMIEFVNKNHPSLDFVLFGVTTSTTMSKAMPMH